MDNLRDVVDDILHVQENLKEEQRDLQDGQRDLQDGQRHLRDDLQNAMPQLQECLAGHRNLRDILDNLKNVVRVVQETIAELNRSCDDQKMECDLLNDKVANVEDKFYETLQTLAGRPVNGIPERRHPLGSQESGNVETQAKSTQETARRMERVGADPMEQSLAARGLTNVANRMADYEVLLIEISNHSIEERRRNMGIVKRQLDTNQENVRRQERRIESIENKLALRNVTLADLEEYVRQQESSSYEGRLLWKISDYARRRNDAVTGQPVCFYSPCFYTSRYGYKMRARIYLNGDGMGVGTHISIFFVVMRGQYDALLRWPFRQKVTFMLLDQDNVKHVIDVFSPDPKSPSFQKPRGETNIASGCPKFCPLAELNNHAYVQDDTMFLEVIVDTSDLKGDGFVHMMSSSFERDQE